MAESYEREWRRKQENLNYEDEHDHHMTDGPKYDHHEDHQDDHHDGHYGDMESDSSDWSDDEDETADSAVVNTLKLTLSVATLAYLADLY